MHAPCTIGARDTLNLTGTPVRVGPGHEHPCRSPAAPITHTHTHTHKAPNTHTHTHTKSLCETPLSCGAPAARLCNQPALSPIPVGSRRFPPSPLPLLSPPLLSSPLLSSLSLGALANSRGGPAGSTGPWIDREIQKSGAPARACTPAGSFSAQAVRRCNQAARVAAPASWGCALWCSQLGPRCCGPAARAALRSTLECRARGPFSECSLSHCRHSRPGAPRSSSSGQV